MDHPELEFFNSISGELEIELTIPTRPIGNLLNQEADADAEIVSLKLEPYIFVEETEDIRDLTERELNQIAFRGKQIKLRNPDADRVITHKAPQRKALHGP